MGRIEDRLAEHEIELPTIVELWGDAGRHARSAPGQGPSPFNVPVIVDAIVAVEPPQAG